MTKLYEDFIDGTLSAGINDTDTSVSAAAFAGLPVVTGGDTLRLVLDPEAVSGDPEIVTVTAHSSSATSVTVTRGADGTTARTHSSGTRVVLGWLASDIEDLQSTSSAHATNLSNPHAVTAAQAGALALSGGTVTGATTFSDTVTVAGVLTVTAEEVVLDSEGTKLITGADGAGDFNLRSGHYSDSGTERHVDAGDGAAHVELTSDGAAGQIRLEVAGVAAGDDDAVSWSKNVVLTTTNFTVDGNKVFHAGNDGAGSGLDADLLDGVQGASYARSDATDTVTTFRFASGSAGAPSVSFSADTDTGFFRVSTNRIGISLGGNARWEISDSYLLGDVAGTPALRSAGSAGSASAPVYSFNGDSDTGWRRFAANQIAVSTGGVDQLVINSQGLQIVRDGTYASPSISWRGDSGYDTGIFHDASLNRIGFTVDDQAYLVLSQDRLAPIDDGTYNELELGSSSYRWGVLYTSAAVNVSSDARLKTQISHLSDTFLLDVVNQVRPAQFVRAGKDALERGFIAQELQAADEALAHEGDDGYLGIRDTELLSTLWGAVRALTAEVEALKDRPCTCGT